MKYYRIKETGAVGESFFYNSETDRIYLCFWNAETFRRRHIWLHQTEVEPATEEEMHEYILKVKKLRYEYLKTTRTGRKNAERDKYIFEQRKAGRTFRSISKEVSLTPQRVRDIYIKEERFK